MSRTVWIPGMAIHGIAGGRIAARGVSTTLAVRLHRAAAQGSV